MSKKNIAASAAVTRSLMPSKDGILIISGENLVVDKVECRSAVSAHQSGQHLPTLREVERDHIRKVLSHVNYNRTKAAQVLGIDRASLWRKLKLYGETTSLPGGRRD